MSDKKWYEDLPYEDFFDWHVNARLLNGTTIYGPLLACDTHVDVDMCGNSYCVLKRDSIHSTWRLADCVTSIGKVWNSRDWKRIEPDEIDFSAGNTYAMVLNGKLREIDVWDTVSAVEDKVTKKFIPVSETSGILRSRPKPPQKPGFYHSDTDTVLYLSKDNEWWMITDSGVIHFPVLDDDYMPLTPIHFEPGEADHE